MPDAEKRDYLKLGPTGGMLYQSDMHLTIVVAQTLMSLPLEEMSNFITHCHSIGPILDPTAYRNGMHNLQDQETIVHALLRAKTRLQQSPKWVEYMALLDRPTAETPSSS